MNYGTLLQQHKDIQVVYFDVTKFFFAMKGKYSN